MKIRLGYVAISNALGKKVTSSSNVTYKTYSKITSEEKKIEKLKSITHSNFEGLEKILRYNIENDIHFYRLTSALILHIQMFQTGDIENYLKRTLNI